MSDQLVVSAAALESLNQTRPWVKFLAILGFIVIGLMVLGGIAMLGGSSLVPGGAGMGVVFALVYFLLALLYFMPCLFLYRYGKAIAAIPGQGQAALDAALKNQKSFWKFMGIVTLVVLSIEVLCIVIAVVGGVAMHH